MGPRRRQAGAGAFARAAWASDGPWLVRGRSEVDATARAALALGPDPAAFDAESRRAP